MGHKSAKLKASNVYGYFYHQNAQSHYYEYGGMNSRI